MLSAPFKAGVQAQQNGEFGGSSDVIHRKDGVRECARWPPSRQIPRGLIASWYFILQRLERFGLRCVARWDHEERGGNWCPGGVRLRRARDAGTVANLTRSVRLLGVSMGSGR